MSETQSFTDRKFHPPLPEHAHIHAVAAQRIAENFDLDSDMFDWEYFGEEKYGRYALCKNTGIKRKLTMGEFYGTSAVD